MKIYFLILSTTFLCFVGKAQNTLTKLKFEEAEKAFYDADYENCVKLLDETEKLLGQPAPKILHLKIMAENKIWEANPYASYEQIENLRNLCNQYMKNYDIAGLEDKFKEVYEIYDYLASYPISKEKFSLLNNDSYLKFQVVFDNYINAIGGIESLQKINTRYDRYYNNYNEDKIWESKIMLPDKSYLKSSHGNFIIVHNGLKEYRKGNDGKIKETVKENNNEYMIFPEFEFIKSLDSSNHVFNFIISDNFEILSIIRFEDETSMAITEKRFYNKKSKLLEKTELSSFEYDKLSKERIGEINQLSVVEYKDYKLVHGIKIPHTIIEKNIENGNSFTKTYVQVYLNEQVIESDFELSTKKQNK